MTWLIGSIHFSEERGSVLETSSFRTKLLVYLSPTRNNGLIQAGCWCTLNLMKLLTQYDQGYFGQMRAQRPKIDQETTAWQLSTTTSKRQRDHLAQWEEDLENLAIFAVNLKRFLQKFTNTDEISNHRWVNHPNTVETLDSPASKIKICEVWCCLVWGAILSLVTSDRIFLVLFQHWHIEWLHIVFSHGDTQVRNPGVPNNLPKWEAFAKHALLHNTTPDYNEFHRKLNV